MNDALTLLKRGGVVGGGGAGFPTWKKLEGQVPRLLVNAAECEPLLKSDQYLMLTQADELIRGARLLQGICGANELLIALKAHYVPQIAALEAAIARAGTPVALVKMPTVYPAGDEQEVVYAATGEAIRPLSLPSSVGCVVVSVSTAINAARALDGVPVTRRLVTVAGEVARPGLYDVPVGMSVAAVVRSAGGATVPGARLMLGGPMMGTPVKPDADPVVAKTCGGILVLAPEHTLIRRAEQPLHQMKNRAKAACIQCRMCTDMCPRYLLGQPLAPHRVMRAFAMGQLEPAALLCVECGICEWYACPMGLSPRRVQAQMKPQLREQGAAPDRGSYPAQRAMHAYRQVPSARLMARLDVRRYDMPVPEHVTVLSADEVRVPLKQHIGAPCVPCVGVGDRVEAGQAVGRMADGALGADVHAPIGGVVVAVGAEVAIRGRDKA